MREQPMLDRVVLGRRRWVARHSDLDPELIDQALSQQPPVQLPDEQEVGTGGLAATAQMQASQGLSQAVPVEQHLELPHHLGVVSSRRDPEPTRRTLALASPASFAYLAALAIRIRDFDSISQRGNCSR
jgi:hypothetical protein